MKEYTVIERKNRKLRGSKWFGRVVILVDTEKDIPEPLEEWVPGSMCQIAETHKYKILNHKREWV